MRSVLYLIAWGLSSGVTALPNKRSGDSLSPSQSNSSPPLSNFCNTVVDGTTVVAFCEPTATTLVRRQTNNACVATGGSLVGFGCEETVVNSAGQTVISNTLGAITLPTGETALITTTFSSGQTTTIDPAQIIIVTTDAAGETVVSNAESAVTFSSTLTTPIETILPNGDSTTFTPILASTEKSDSASAQIVASTGTNSAGLTVISRSGDGAMTIPTGITTPIATVFPDGESITISPSATTLKSTTSSSSGTAGGFIIPVTTPVESPKHTDGGILVPCNFFWFFDLCPSWDSTTIGGWIVGTPTGIHPPGPPPPLLTAPGISASVPTPLPPWPQWTNPPQGPPEASPKPDDCQTQTGEVCFYHTSVSAVTTNEATTTSTKVLSTCATVVGCDVESTETSTTTTASSTPTTAIHVVYPKDGRDESQTEAIAGELQKLVNNLADLQTSTTKTFGLNFWLLPADADLAAKIRSIPNVESVFAQCGSGCTEKSACDNPCSDPTISNVYQEDAEAQLGYISWSRSQPSLPSRYLFDDSAGDDMPVYVVDTGATLSHREFNIVRDKTRWMFVGPDLNGNAPSRSDSMKADRSYHGTAMLSLVAGVTLGVAKKISPVIVRLPGALFVKLDENGQYDVKAPEKYVSSYTPEHWLTALGMVNDELQRQDGGAASCVVLLATYFPRIKVDDAWVQRSHAVLQEMAVRGAIVVTGQGNIRGGSAARIVDGWPANFGKNDQDLSLDSLIVASSIWTHEEESQYVAPASGLPHVYAPGFEVIVANGDPLAAEANRGGGGTSDAAALTAGLAAYFLRLSQLGQLKNDDGTAVDRTPLGMKRFMVEKSYSRYGTGRNGIFNAIDATQQFCRWNDGQSAPLLIRQESSSQCLIPSSATSAEVTTSTAQATSAKPTTSTTQTSSQPTISLSPSLAQSLSCHDEADFPGHADLQRSAVITYAGSACARWTGYPYGCQDTKLGPNSDKLSHTYHSQGVSYAYSVGWAVDCKLSGTTTQSVYAPVGSKDVKDTCLGLWVKGFEQCNNGGVGGSVTVGCLMYTFTGGE